MIKRMVNLRAKMKVWVIIDTCMSSGSVYINIAQKQDTAAFLMAWENFINIRGRLKTETKVPTLQQVTSMSASSRRRRTTTLTSGAGAWRSLSGGLPQTGSNGEMA